MYDKEVEDIMYEEYKMHVQEEEEEEDIYEKGLDMSMWKRRRSMSIIIRSMSIRKISMSK